jgi:hypothetical protein
LQNLVGEPITLAEHEIVDDPEWYTGRYDESHTWTLFVLETSKGRVEFWWLGESNGYYGEEVDFVRTN